MNIRFFNARILTMEEGRKIFSGEVWVSGDRILYVGEGRSNDDIFQELKIPVIIWDREIDCNGNLLMPGFKDAHTHSGMTLLRSFADDLPLDQWLNQQIFPVEALLTGDEIGELTKLAVLEYLTSGITAVFDMYLTPETIINAYTECGMRNVQVSGLNMFGPTPEVMEERFLKLNGVNSLSSYMLGIHAEYTCPKELLMQVAEIVKRHKAPFFTHLAETKREVEECKERYGMTPTQLLNDLGLFDYGGGGYHCVYMDDKDIEIFKEKKLTAVTNPASNLKLASGIAPVSRFLKEGIPVAIGTDGAGSNNCLDMFREMFLVTGLAKYRDMDAASTDAIEVLKMATVNGAKAMGLTDSDVLAPGKYADLIMIDMHQPNMQPINNIAKNIVYSGSKQNVKMTMIDGKILYEDGKFFIGEDPEKLYAKANEIADRLRQE